jgi:hypothetical protein
MPETLVFGDWQATRAIPKAESQAFEFRAKIDAL